MLMKQVRFNGQMAQDHGELFQIGRKKKMCISGNAKSMKKNAQFYAKSKIEFTFISSKIFQD